MCCENTGRESWAAWHNPTFDTGIPVSMMLFTGSDTPAWNSVSWNSVSWNSVNWNSVSWNSVSWNSTSWTSDIRTSSLWEDTEAGEIPNEARSDESGLAVDETMGGMASRPVREEQAPAEEEQAIILSLPVVSR